MDDQTVRCAGCVWPFPGGDLLEPGTVLYCDPCERAGIPKQHAQSAHELDARSLKARLEETERARDTWKAVALHRKEQGAYVAKLERAVTAALQFIRACDGPGQASTEELRGALRPFSGEAFDGQ